MKLLLISPKGWTRENSIVQLPEVIEYYDTVKKKLFEKGTLWDGLCSALPTIAGLTPDNFEIEIVDENVETLDFTRECDVVGITMMTHQAVRGYEIATEFKKRNIKVAIGGIHATVMPEEAKQYCDSVLLGEGEATWPYFIEDFLNGEVKPFYKSNEMVDLTKSPMPRYELLRNKGYNTIWIQTSRGCPHDCDFCVVSSVHGKKRRYKTIEQVIEEVKYIKQHFGYIHIGFSDENFLVNRKVSKEVLTAFIPLNIRWHAFTDISVADDDELLQLAKDSGCVSLLLGLESVNSESLKDLDLNNWKLKRSKDYSQCISKIQSYGIGVVGSFILGLDSDEADIFDKTSRFIKENHLYAAFIGVLNPYPGTRLRERLKEENRVLQTNWDNYTKSGINIIPKRMSIQQLSTGMSRLLNSIYNQEVALNTLRHFKEIL